MQARPGHKISGMTLALGPTRPGPAHGQCRCNRSWVWKKYPWCDLCYPISFSNYIFIYKCTVLNEASISFLNVKTFMSLTIYEKTMNTKENPPRAQMMCLMLFEPFFDVAAFHISPHHAFCRVQTFICSKILVSIKKHEGKKKKLT